MLSQLFRGAHWPLTYFDQAGKDLAWTWKLITKSRKQKNQPGSGYTIHKRAFRSFLIFLVGVGLGLLSVRMVAQPWIILVSYVIGSYMHLFAPTREGLTEVMQGMALPRSRFEEPYRQMGLPFVTGVIMATWYPFAGWIVSFSPVAGTVLQLLFFVTLVTEAVSIVYRWWISRSINSASR